MSLSANDLPRSSQAAPSPRALDSYPDVLTTEDMAEILRIPVSTVYDLAQRGVLPARKLGRHWRCSKAALLRFLAGEQAAPDPPKPRVRRFVLVR